MPKKVKFDDKEYDIDRLSAQGKVTASALEFANSRLKELTSMQILLNRAKGSYLDTLKREILSKKAGFLTDEN